MIRKSIQTFIDVFWKSVSNKLFFKSILSEPFIYSLLFLFILLLILQIASVWKNTLWIWNNVPTLHSQISVLENSLETIYPEELVLTIKDGELMSNVPEPYVIRTPPEWLRIFNINESKNLAVIDTKADIEKFNSYDSLLLITKNSVVYNDQTGIHSQSFAKDSEELVIDKVRYTVFINFIRPLITNFIPFIKFGLVFYVVFGPLIGASIWLLIYLFYVLCMSVILILISKMIQSYLIYSQIFHISIYGLTLPIVSTFVLSVVGVWIPFLFTLIFMTWMTIILGYLRDNQEVIKVTN